MSAPAQMVGSLDLQQLGLLHDVQLDYYGKRVAAASADHTVHIWDITDGGQKPLGQLKGHEGPVWKVSWAHPKFGSLIATCSYDMKVIIWKEVSFGQWQMAYADSSHTASVNDVEFCPFDHGLRLACASSDGTVSILSHDPASQQWRRTAFQAHPGGAQGVSWMPIKHREGAQAPVMRMATCGCDHAVHIWKWDGEVPNQEVPLPPAHTNWVRGVAWRPDGSNVVASGGWDQAVIIWKQEVEGQPWRPTCRFQVAGKVERLSWSVTGSILAVSFADSETALYKEAGGQFEEVGKVGEQGYEEVVSQAAAALLGHTNSGQLSSDQGVSPQAPPADRSPPVVVNADLAAQQQAVLSAFGMT